MSDQRLVLDLSGLAVESVEVAPADSLESATYGYGMTELAASCCCQSGQPAGSCGGCGFMPVDSEDE